jgi:transcription-repair coupling factor (superfamily II helicase)
VFGASAAMFPSWETLPHERLSPGVETVGARLLLLRGWPSPTTPGSARRCGW